jgi:apolipoprotein N-acyltransferase
MSSWFWLIPGFICLVFSNGRWVIPAAAWLYPLFLLKFSHRQPLWRGFVVISLVLVTANSIAWQGTATANPTSPLQVIPAGFGFLIAFIFLAERWLAPRLNNGTASLVFPLLYVAFEWLVTLFSPLGSIGMLGYTQSGNLPLLQLTSLTGVTGISFLVAWFGSLSHWIWQQQFHWLKIHRWIAAYAAVILLVLFYGSARLVFSTPGPGAQGSTVRVAGITITDRQRMAALDQARVQDPLAYQKMLSEIERFAFETTLREAQAGAKIVLWNEVGIYIENDAAPLVIRAQTLARQAGIYLLVPLYITHPGSAQLDINKLLLINPQGKIVLEHLKYGSAVLEDIQPGSGIIQAVSTPFGSISAVICRDLDFPTTVRQTGRIGTQILLAPSFDWYAIDPFHSQYAIFRAVENGVSLVRQAADGYSVATDPYGRVIAATDHFASQERVMVAQVPVIHIPTLYSYLGDWFNWAAVVLLAWLISQAFHLPRAIYP